MDRKTTTPAGAEKEPHVMPVAANENILQNKPKETPQRGFFKRIADLFRN